MKTMMASLATFTALTAAVAAADLPRRAAPPPVFTPVPVFTWTGAYFGINAGYGFDASTRTNNLGVGIAPGASPLFPAAGGTLIGFSGQRSQEGFTGGGQVGYNYQFTPGSGVVIGFEADAQYVDFGRDRNRNCVSTLATGTCGGGAAPGTLIFNPSGLASLDFFGTVRGRLGYAFDRVLVYGTGGFAYGAGGGRDFGLPNSSRDDFKTGWTVGGGFEYALPTDSFLNFFRSSAVTFKVEGLYVNLDRGNQNNGIFASNGLTSLSVFSPGVALGNSVTFAPISPSVLRRDTEFAVVRAGLNYKFGSF
ncbi:outer membrane protein [Methylobacterium brachiatum]|jgi:outer membrane immunogenic protein|uniref:outer membrane protein n=1 Tax=Methylobacterium brachiatum TaxID=269660 RepID=UPI002448A607|nr:outer membrane beta-barrel protein [Methylobacterium brachiatum]MDH2310557.1 outer membrane beta-barrel protein [Methylobacterium brachiatum]